MRHRIALALVLALICCIPAHSQAPDEVPGTQSQIIASVPTGGFSCGRASYPLYCYGIPTNVGGSFWLDVQYNAYPSPTGFIAFNQVVDLGQGTITGATMTKNSSGQITNMSITFTGGTNDGDGGTYSGTGTFAFTYYHVAGGGGRGSSGYYVQVLQSGTLTITYH
jgi:hypothetical protein